MIQSLRRIAHQIFKQAQGAPIQIFIRMKKGILVRFTNNGVHQNTSQDLFSYTLRLLTKNGPVWVESNDTSKEEIRAAIARLRVIEGQPLTLPPAGTAIRGTRLRVPSVALVEPVRQSRAGGAGASPSSPQRGEGRIYLRVKEHFPLRLEKIPEQAAEIIERAVRLIRARQASANGYFSAYERFFYLADASGLEAFHPATAVRFGATLTKGAGKGYFSFYHPNPKKLDVDSVVEEAAELAESASRVEVSLEPGEYECIFSPRAFLELIEPLRRHFDSQLCKDRKSVLSGLQGKKIFSENFTLHDDLGHSGQFGVPFDAEGNPKRKVALVERGVLKELLSEGHSTRGLLEHPVYPQNFVLHRGNFSREELFRRIRRGIFINKIWYHTLVRESEMEVTGLATAGSLYIEKGRIRGRVSSLRYHDSLFSILRSVAGTTKERILLKDGEMGAALFPYLWVSRLRVVS